MAGYPNKIIINHGGGNRAAIEAEFEIARELGAEIVEHELLQAAQQFRDELAPHCEEHDKADAKFLRFISDQNRRIAAWLDEQLGLNTPLPTSARKANHAKVSRKAMPKRKKK